MKRWNTTQQMANDIAKIDESSNKELNISQCNLIAKNVKNLCKVKGKEYMLNHIRNTLPGLSGVSDSDPDRKYKTTFSMEQKDRAVDVVKRLFRWYWFPLSRIRNNMVRLCK